MEIRVESYHWANLNVIVACETSRQEVVRLNGIDTGDRRRQRINVLDSCRNLLFIVDALASSGRYPMLDYFIPVEDGTVVCLILAQHIRQSRAFVCTKEADPAEGGAGVATGPVEG